MSKYTFTPEELISGKKQVLGDGSIVIGETVIDAPKVGKAVVGRGTAGVGTGAGSNIFKANAIEHILSKGRGRDGTYLSNGGIIGWGTGVTEKDIEDHKRFIDYNRLKDNNTALREAGLREVEWGDTDATVSKLFQIAEDNKALKAAEPGRVKRDTKLAQLEVQALNREIQARNERGKQFEANQAGLASDRTFRKDEAEKANTLANRVQTSAEATQRFNESLAAQNAQNRWDDKREARREDALTREMNAENNAMQMQLEYSRLAQADATRAQDRKDKAIMALLGGLGNLGAAFTI